MFTVAFLVNHQGQKCFNFKHCVKWSMFPFGISDLCTLCAEVMYEASLLEPAPINHPCVPAAVVIRMTLTYLHLEGIRVF